MLYALSALLFPPAPHCVSCARPLTGFFQTDFCKECVSQFVFAVRPFCQHCGRPLAGAAQGKDQLCHTCSYCKLHFAISRAALVYNDQVRALVHRFKYDGQISLGQALGRLMAQRLERFRELNKYKVIVPIPLHPETAAIRSFNQALILAGEVADKTNRVLYPDVLQRLPGSALQHTLSRRQRRQGLAGEFYVSDPGRINGRRVLIVDDVLTTGNTLSEAARVLVRAGAKEVAGYTLAIGLSEDDGY